MTVKIVYIADTHQGAGQTGFQQQPRRMDLTEPVFAGLRRHIRENKVDLVIHGGDLTDHGTGEEIQQAVALLKGLGAPVAYCLGNHDLAMPDSFACWNGMGGRDSGLWAANRTIPLEGLDVILVNNAWLVDSDIGMYWKSQKGWQERLAAESHAWLESALAGDSDRPAVLVFHTPPDPIPPRLTGLPEPIHGAYPPYVAEWEALLTSHPRVKLVLNGHNHATVATCHAGRVHLTVSSLLEAPFEFRVVSWEDRSMSVDTVAAIEMPPDAAYDSQRAWVNGQPGDRRLAMNWGRG